jgi:hypothetical protein
MAPLLKNLLGNGSKDRELAEEMRAILNEMQEERSRCEADRPRASADHLQQLGTRPTATDSARPPRGSGARRRPPSAPASQIEEARSPTSRTWRIRSGSKTFASGSSRR